SADQGGVDAGDAAGGAVRVGGRALRGPPPGCVDHAGAGQAAGVVVTVVLHQLSGFQAGWFLFGGRRAGPDEGGHAFVLGAGQAGVAPAGSRRRTAGRPAWWDSSWRTVIASLFAAANSGQ